MAEYVLIDGKLVKKKDAKKEQKKKNKEKKQSEGKNYILVNGKLVEESEAKKVTVPEDYDRYSLESSPLSFSDLKKSSGSSVANRYATSNPLNTSGNLASNVKKEEQKLDQQAESVSKVILGTDEEPRDANFWDVTWRSIKQGYNNARLGEETYKYMYGEKNDRQTYLDRLESDEYNFAPSNWLEEGVSGAAQQIGQMVRQYTHPRSLAAAGTAAGMAALAGQAGPQVIVPEEIISVPAAALAGFAAGGVASNLEIEAGHAYNEMIEAGLSEETSRNVALGVGGVNAALEMLQVDELVDAYKIVKGGASKSFTKELAKILLDRGIDVATETAQEVAQEGVTIAGTQFASKAEKGEWAYSADQVGERLKDTAVSSALTFGMLNVPATATNISSAEGDYKAANTLTADEQAVYDKVVESKIAEKEKDGKKLTASEKNDIKKTVRRKLENGEITADQIESVLGGEAYTAFKDEMGNFFASDDYKAYQKAAQEQEALPDLEEELANLGKSENTVENNRKYDDLKSRIEAIKSSTTVGDLEAKLSPEATRITQMRDAMRNDVFNRVKDSRLAETYAELERSKQKFTVDIEQYKDENARKTVQNVLDSGFGDNTNKFHHTVDFLAKLSADKGVVFTLTNTEALKGTEHYRKGFVTHGFVSDDGKITLNYDSERVLETTVGHEITHVLEKTDNYKAFQQAVFEYAKSKEGVEKFNARLEAAKEAYDGKTNTTAEGEVTADLIGEYLFTDYDFVNNLATTNRNVFQKVYDEIKYMAKIATAGSKEARQLEKAKKMFDKAYRESGEGEKNTTDNGGVQYSIRRDIVDVNGKEYDSVVELDKMVSTSTLSDPVKFLKYIENNLVGLQIPVEDASGNIEVIEFAKSNERTTKNGSSHPVLGELAYTKGDTRKQVIVNAKEVIEESVYDPGLSSPNSSHGWLDKNGWEARKTFVLAQDGNIYEAYLRIAKAQDGRNILYAVNLNIKNGVAVDMGATQKRAAVIAATPSGDNIAQEDPNVKSQYSLTKDSQGKELTAEQSEFFKDSKAVDELGNLVRVYHGTRNADFTVFKRNATYFTDNKEMADSYSPNGDMYEGYVNITKPFEIDAQGEKWSRIPIDEDMKEFLEKYGSSVFEEDGEWRTSPADIVAAIEEAIEEGEMDYDGIIIKNVDDTGSYYKGKDSHLATDYIAFNSNQFKNVDNTKPTSDPDIRYSMTKAEKAKMDADYMEAVNKNDEETMKHLVREYAKQSMPESKLVDENGDLRVVYHGTNTGDFTVFNPDYIGMSSGDDGFFGMGFYFAYSKGEASYYGAKRIIPAYLDIKNPFNFDKELRTYNGKKAMSGHAPDAVALMNFADKFPDIAMSITLGVSKEYGKVESISLFEFSKAFKDVIENKTFEYEETVNNYGEKETIVTADPEVHSYEYNGETHTYRDFGFQKRWYGTPNEYDVAYEYLANSVYSYIDMPRMTNIILDNNREFTATLKEMGYDGTIQSEYGDEAVTFEPSQIKSAAPITRDENGEVIPLSKRFDRSNDDIRYSMSKVEEQVNAYEENLKHGDMFGAEMAVEELANLSMPDSKIRDENGRLIPVYHGTKAMFWEFDTSADGGKNGTAEGYGIYLSDNQDVTNLYGDRQIKMFANITKPATSFDKTINKNTLVKLIKDTCEKQAQQMVDEEGYDSLDDALRDTWVSNYVMTYDMSMAQAYREVAESFLKENDNDKDIIHEVMFGMAIRSYDRAMDFYNKSLIPVTGIDGFITKWTNPNTGEVSNIYLAFDSSQLKSADAVTRDDQGNVIPITERFNFDKKDIRYSMTKEGAEENTFGNQRTHWQDFGYRDLLDLPMKESAPVAEKSKTTLDDMLPANIDPEEELDSLFNRLKELEEEVVQAANAEDSDAYSRINEEWKTVQNRIDEIRAEQKQRVDSLTDEDVPPEMNAEPVEMAGVIPLTQKVTKEIAKQVREQLGLSNKQMYDVHMLIEEYSKSEFPDREQLFRSIKEKFGTYTESEFDETVKEAKDFLRSYPINVDDYIKQDIADYDVIRKENGKHRRLRFSEDGTDVDVLYHELNSLYPHLFPESIINPTDMFLQIVDVANMDAEMKTEVALPDEAIWDVADSVIRGVNEYRYTQTEKASSKFAKEAFNSLMKDADRYDPMGEDLPMKQEAPKEAEKPVYKGNTVIQEHIQKKIDNTQAELDKNRLNREQSFQDYNEEIARLEEKYESKKNKNSLAANGILRSIERMKRMQGNIDADYAKRISDLEARVEKMSSPEYSRAEHRRAKMAERTEFWENLIGDTSTWKDMAIGLAYKTKTLRRILRHVVRDTNGKPDIALADHIYDELETKYDHNEASLKKESKRLKERFFDMKLNSAEDTYAHMLGEFRYNPETTLTEDVVKEYYEKHKKKIDTKKVDSAIEEARKTFDELIVRVNEALRENGFKEIPYRKGYFPHFTNPKQNWLQKVFNWKPIDNEIPTSIAGLTEDFKPQRSWQAFDKQRKGDTTDYSLYQGLDTYIHGALDWIYHIDDLQSRRALENHIRYIHSEEGVQKRIDEIKANETYSADEAQDMIDAVLAEASNPLGGLVRELMDRTNTLANKKAAGDRKMESDFNRKVYSTMTNLNNRINANMVVGSFSSALTNFIPMVQSWHQVSPFYTVRGLGDMIRSTVKDDGMIAKSDFLTNRLVEEEKLYQTGWDKVSDKAGWLMNVVDSITSQTVWRSKYLQNLQEGMSENAAIKDADQFAKNLMAGRSRGNMPSIFDEKNPVTKIFTAFQLEVANQYGYMFEDVPQDSKNKARMVKGYAMAFLGAYAYNTLYSSLVGRDAAFDPISIIEDLLKDMFGDDEEKEPEEVLMNLGENIVQEVPFVGGLLGGGRIPLSSVLPYSGDSTPFESMLTDVTEGNWDSFGKEFLKPLYYLAMPVGGGQLKKTVEGLSMFDDDLPISGSYTDSGKLRFPVEKNVGNVIQAGLFGQYASKNAREYFDEGYAPLGEKQIEEYKNSDLPISDYWKYREGLKGLDKLGEKADYIDSLDLPINTKNYFMNNIADRKELIDMSDYDEYDSFDEFDFASKNPDKYEFFENEGISYKDYATLPQKQKDAWNNAWEWAKEKPDQYKASKVVTDDVIQYKEYTSTINAFRADKDKNGKSISGTAKKKKIDYINSLDLEYGKKLILYRDVFPTDNRYNKKILEYVNSRDDLTFDDKVSVLRGLDFHVDSKGNVSWD